MTAHFDQWADGEWFTLPRELRVRGCEWMRAHDVEPNETTGVTFPAEGAAIAHIRFAWNVVVPVPFRPRTPPPWVLG